VETTTNQNKTEEKTFELTITNGAAKRLQSLIDHFGGDETKVVSLALELLSLVKNSEKVEFKNKGENDAKGVVIPTTLDIAKK